jgi:hypothetical protein
MEHWWNDPGGRKQKYLEIQSSSAPLPITDLRRTDPGLKPGLRGERPTINRLDCEMVLKTKFNLNYT